MQLDTNTDSTLDPMPQIILGSTSPFRKLLLDKLNIPFVQSAPDIDESPLLNESPKEMVARLSLKKAEVIATSYDDAIIIASDQTAVFNNQPIGKPHSVENAIKQLTQFSGNRVTFYTGLSVINTRTHKIYECMNVTKVHFRPLSQQVIRNYIEIEKPLNCAGSFKSEGLGVTLFKAIETNDPNALIGLSLIDLTDIFYKMGYPLPLSPAR